MEVLYFWGSEMPPTWETQGLASAELLGGQGLVWLYSAGGDTGDEWNTYVFGIASPDVSRVEVEGVDGVGGQVADGAWVIASREKDLTPDDIDWRFVDPYGAVLASGHGIGRAT